MSQADLSLMFFLQMALIVATCRALGWLVKRFLGQPQVVGEIVAGIMLGPSLLGALAPELQTWLFPKPSRDMLFIVAQLGIGLYMFVVGLGFNVGHFKANARSAAAVSASGMAAPFIGAAFITPWLLSKPGLFAQGVAAPQAALFMGACIAITAFPVLARIIEERRLSNTPLGALTLSAGAVDDVGAWTTLAIVLASLGAGAGVAIKAILGAAIIALFMLTVAPRLLGMLARHAELKGKVSHFVLGAVIAVFMLSAYVSDYIGLHAVFGGFMLGAVMPRGVLATELRRMLEPIATVVFVPVFFCYSGLNTEFTVVNNPSLVFATLIILLVSITAKFGACWAAARLTGQDNATALAIGSLMNARGLMELIIINIGLQRGVIETPLFSMLVIMTIVTTVMATPLFELFYGKKARENGELGALTDEDTALGDASLSKHNR